MNFDLNSLLNKETGGYGYGVFSPISPKKNNATDFLLLRLAIGNNGRGAFCAKSAEFAATYVTLNFCLTICIGAIS